jgi:hypothetical protein
MNTNLIPMNTNLTPMNTKCNLFFYLWLRQPILLVVILGIANSVFLIVVAYQALVFRYRRTDKCIVPSKLYDMFLLASVLAIGFVAVRSLVAALQNWLGLLN